MRGRPVPILRGFPGLVAVALATLILAACGSAPDTRDDLSDRHELLKGQDRSTLHRTAPTGLTREEAKSISEPEGSPGGEAVVAPGTGIFVRNIPSNKVDVQGPALRGQEGRGADGSGDSGATASGEVITLNYVNAPLRVVIRDVLGGILRLNYHIAPGIDGTITLQSRIPLDEKSVLPVLDSVLRMNDAAIVKQGDLYRVVPLSQANELDSGRNIEILALRHASAAELVNVLQPFAGESTVVQVDPARNVIILAGPSEDIASLADLAMAFDVDWGKGMSYALYPLSSAQPSEMVAELNQIFREGNLAPTAGLVRFVPIDRRNSILVAAKQERLLDRARSWIERLDAPDAGKKTIHVYPLQYRRAGDVAEVLLSLFDGTSVAGIAETLPNVMDGQSNDGALPEQPAETPLPVTAGAGGSVHITADTLNNAIVVLAREPVYQRIRSALERLDTLPPQVLIEATIAEVALNDALQYGIQWFFRSGNSEFRLRRGIEPVPPLGPASTGFSYFLNASDVRIAIDALRSVTDVEIVSTPRVMVLDNQTARLQIGDQVPIVTRTAQSVTDPEAPVVNSIEYRDTGVVLEVTPRVNQSGLVTLDIMQEVSNVNQIATQVSPVESPTIEQRKIASTVAVRSGDIIALGGLISDHREDQQDGIPILGEIPILGNLFKSTSIGSERRELLVLIRPRIVRSQLESWTVTEELRRKIRDLQRKDQGLPSLLDRLR